MSSEERLIFTLHQSLAIFKIVHTVILILIQVLYISYFPPGIVIIEGSEMNSRNDFSAGCPL